MADISIDTQVKLNDDVLFQEVQGDSVLLDLSTGVYFGLDKVGTRIWQLMGDHGRLSGVADRLEAEFEVTRERCESDVISLAQQLQEQGLILICS